LRDWPAENSGAELWSDAEQFLETIDSAVGSDAAWYVGRAHEYLSHVYASQAIPMPGIEQLSAAGRRLLAAECCGFLPHLRKDSEPIRPFRRWLSSTLAKEDAIITFNYDRAVEQIAAWYGGAVQQVNPFSPVRDGTNTPLFKLHGSVDWRREPSSDAIGPTDEVEFALKCSDEELAIASPGPNKLNLSAQLRRLWQVAMKEVCSADAIVIVGYRLPHGDAFAREQLLEALQQNKQPHLKVRVVLGPNIADPFSVRLLELLKQAMQSAGRQKGTSRVAHTSYLLTVHTLFGQDFLERWNRKSILFALDQE